eukprot:5752456-Amphidinium_carterae.1
MFTRSTPTFLTTHYAATGTCPGHQWPGEGGFPGTILQEQVERPGTLCAHDYQREEHFCDQIMPSPTGPGGYSRNTKRIEFGR